MANAHRCRFKRLATNSYARLKIQIKNAPNGRFFELMAEWTGYSDFYKIPIIINELAL